SVWMVGADARGNGQRAIAQGPGRIDLFDRATNSHPRHALWQEQLETTKDRQGERVFDLLTLTGDAAVLDDSQEQQLHAHRLPIWLGPTERVAAEPTPAQTASTNAPRQKPHKLEAFEGVRLTSPELNIRDAEHLTAFQRHAAGRRAAARSAARLRGQRQRAGEG